MAGGNGGLGCCMVDGVTAGMAGFVITAMFASAFAAVAAGLIFDSIALPIGMAGVSSCAVIGQSDEPDSILASQHASAPTCRLPMPWAGLVADRGVDVSSQVSLRVAAPTG